MKYDRVLISELKNQIHRNIYCFGAGRAFDKFMEEFAQFELEKRIKAVADNNPIISVKVISNQNIPVISLKNMLNIIDDNDFILITTAAYREIIDQLNKIDQLKSVSYGIYSIMKIEQYDFDRLQIKLPKRLSLYDEMRIPKVIHYCWFGRKAIPNQYKEWMASWKKYCPDYEIIEWNEDNYDVHKNSFISQAYDMGKWAYVSDYARIDIVNEYGGVYMDTDVELVKNIDELLKNDAFCGFENNRFVAYGLGFGAKKHSLILEDIKEYYNNISFAIDETLSKITCPVIQTNVLEKHGMICNGEFQILDGMMVYPSQVLCGMSPYSFRMQCDLTNTYAIHHYNASWLQGYYKQWKNKLILDMKEWGWNDGDYIYLD